MDFYKYSEKKKRRLARNRESARQSRKRKKQYLELLEDKVEQLTVEVNLLRQKRLEQAAKELHQQWQSKLSLLEPDAVLLTQELKKRGGAAGAAGAATAASTATSLAVSSPDTSTLSSEELNVKLAKLDRSLRLAKTRFGPNSEVRRWSTCLFLFFVTHALTTGF